jgi:hypothetical protein
VVSKVATVVLGFLLVTSCGPSVQSIYEGNVRFEHCYRLDLELSVASSHRQACWTSWLDRYTYGQSRDRIEYARRRVRGFAAGDANRPALDLGPTQQEETRQFYLVVPAPTSVHAPPPPIATRMNAVVPPPTPSVETKPSEKAAPGADCESSCKSAFTSCNQACDPAAKSAACKSCDPDYKKCMARCFE